MDGGALRAMLYSAVLRTGREPAGGALFLQKPGLARAAPRHAPPAARAAASDGNSSHRRSSIPPRNSYERRWPPAARAAVAAMAPPSPAGIAAQSSPSVRGSAVRRRAMRAVRRSVPAPAARDRNNCAPHIPPSERHAAGGGRCPSVSPHRDGAGSQAGRYELP